MSNPFAALLENETEKNDKTEPRLNAVIESIFGFTLKRYDASDKKELIYLEELAQTFSKEELDTDSLEHILFERLLLQDPENYILSNDINKNSHSCETKVILYLYVCFKRTNEYSDISNNVKHIIKSLIMRNVVTALKQSDIFENQNVYSQWYDIFKEMDSYSEDFVMEIYKEFLQDDDGIYAMMLPFTYVLKLVHVDAANATPTIVPPVIYNVLHIYASHEHLADILLNYCKPVNIDVGAEYANTLLGALFSISILPKTVNGSYEFFQNPLDQTTTAATESMLWSRSDNITQELHGLFLNLLKCSPKIKLQTLRWLGGCLKANVDRGKLWNAQVPEFNSGNFSTVTDGFMINFGIIMLRLCQPFSSNISDDKILKVDPTYCAVVNEDCEMKNIHLLDMSKETCLIPAADSDEDRPVARTYSFVTECFYMCHRALDLGFRVTVDKLVKLNQEMVRIERAYNDALQQAGALADVVDSIKQRMESELKKYLSLKSKLSEPLFLKMMFDFLSASAVWFTQVAVNVNRGVNNSFAPLKRNILLFPIPNEVPNTLTCIPEFLVENIVCFLVFLRRFNPKLFEEQDYQQLDSFLSFILVHMGSPHRMRNPHLRARLAEALEALLPHHADEPTGLNNLGGFQRERLFKEHKHKVEITRNLLDVFVSIEVTGQSVQFEQKFNYRRPMYMVMDYLWENSDYQQSFKQLANEAQRNMEAVTPPLFLRFINLLMNDAVFLLDEALSNMAKLKEMQTARERGEWDRLSATERAQNLGYLQQVGMLAKFDNILGRDTIRTLEHLTSQITTIFTHNTMVDRIAAMLNYFLFNLVGPNQKNFKVKDQKEFSFNPASTVLDICKIYVNLKNSDAFCLAVSQDGRSYNPQLFSLAEDVLVRIGGGGLVGELQEVAAKVSEKAVEYQANEVAVAEAPDHFLDPIMSTLMKDPVVLPSSKQTVDRSTIARHLLSDQTDPFNRSPLSMDQIIPNVELAEEIQKWLSERRK